MYFHPAAAEFYAIVQGIRPFDAKPLKAVRGRNDAHRVENHTKMGPPPACVAGDGRYNRRGIPVLYLCDCEWGVIREIARKHSGEIVLQDFLVDFADLRVANLSDANLSSFVRAVFDIAESCNVPERAGPKSYTFSQVVADIVQAAGFDAMLVPGVHGGDRTYRNVVVFGKLSRWTAWSRGSDGFRRIRVP